MSVCQPTTEQMCYCEVMQLFATISPVINLQWRRTVSTWSEWKGTTASFDWSKQWHGTLAV